MMMTTMMNEAAQESRLRRMAKKHDWGVRKSGRTGGYAVVDIYTNSLIFGWDFSATLDEVQEFLTSWK